MVQEGQLLSFGRPTYGRMGRLDVSPKSDDCVPEAKPVDNLPGVTVAGMAAGQFPLHSQFYCQPYTYTAAVSQTCCTPCHAACSLLLLSSAVVICAVSAEVSAELRSSCAQQMKAVRIASWGDQPAACV